MCGRHPSACFAILATWMTLSGCFATPGGFETLTATMTELNGTLPTASVDDTRQTQQEVATHRSVFLAICEEVTPDVCDGVPR